jgi:hypothetical protein
LDDPETNQNIKEYKDETTSSSLDVRVTFVQILDFYEWILNPSKGPKSFRGACHRLDNTSLPFLE